MPPNVVNAVISNSTRKKIERVIDGRDNSSVYSKVLSVVSLFYGLAMRARSKMYHAEILARRRLDRKVISIGNLTLGGTGKTPMTIYLARWVQSLGLKPAIVSRGYRGRYENSLGVASDGREILLKPDQCGDEPYLMAAELPGVPVIVGKDRYLSGRTAIEMFNPDVIVLDDAYQHIRMKRDVNLLLMDAENPVGNGKIFPRGILREPVSAIKRADALIITRAPFQKPKSRFFKQIQLGKEIPVFTCRHRPEAVFRFNPQGTFDVCDETIIKKDRFIAFSGIANNLDFRRLLMELGCEPSNFIHFSDHHQYTRRDIRTILESAREQGVDSLVTTEKDAVKIIGNDFYPYKLYALRVRISFAGRDESRFHDFLKSRLLIYKKLKLKGNS